MVNARVRWAILLAVLLATLAAIAYPVDDAINVVAPGGGPRRAVVNSAQTKPASTASTPVEEKLDWVATEIDPFAPQSWAPVITPEPERAYVAPVAAEVAAPEISPLPYKFIGQMADGADRVLYLGRGEQVHLARQGDVLDGTYKIVLVAKTHVEFESVESGLKQTLPIPAQETN